MIILSRGVLGPPPTIYWPWFHSCLSTFPSRFHKIYSFLGEPLNKSNPSVDQSWSVDPDLDPRPFRASLVIEPDPYTKLTGSRINIERIKVFDEISELVVFA